jgi:hypothetical protein
MFDGVSTHFLLPILEEKYVVSKIIHAIRTNQVGFSFSSAYSVSPSQVFPLASVLFSPPLQTILQMPRLLYLLPFFKLFPTKCLSF